MKIYKFIFISLILGLQVTAVMAWEASPTKKTYSIYKKNHEIGNPVNVVARASVSSRTGNIGSGEITVDLTPNITHGNIIHTSDILSMIPIIAAICDRDFPDQPVDSFSVDIRFIADIWDEYREFVLQVLNEAPGKIEFKSMWFQQKSQSFSRSNKYIATIQKSVSENMASLADPIVMISNEINFDQQAIGRDWDFIREAPDLHLEAPPVVIFVPKGIVDR